MLATLVVMRAGSQMYWLSNLRAFIVILVNQFVFLF